MEFKTPYYLLDESQLLKNLQIIKQVYDQSGAESLLALKCFSTWSVFPLMKEFMQGTTSSSLFEAKLGYEKFGKETHAYSVAYPDHEIAHLVTFCDKIIFNSVSQLEYFLPQVKGKNIGLRINPGISYSHFDLADPARPCSRLGTVDYKELERVLPHIQGVMIHFNCENSDFEALSAELDEITSKYSKLFEKLEWISLGGGIAFTAEGYPLDRFIARLNNLKNQFNIKIYLEPGEAAVTRSCELVTTVLDIVHNETDIAIVDASTEAHMLDLLIYRLSAKVLPDQGEYSCMVAGRSCLAGDIFGTFRFPSPLRKGSEIRFQDAAGYTMVKKNWFNGLPMPSIVVKRLDGTKELIRSFDYKDFENQLS